MKPPLVIVTGPPAAGKSTLVVGLARELKLPYVMKDIVKEALMNILGAETLQESQRLGRAAQAAIEAVARSLLDAGLGVVIESAFVKGEGHDLAPLVQRSRAVVIHCFAKPGDLLDRYRERALSGSRHPGHHDLERVPDLSHKLRQGEYEPPQLGVPVLRLESRDGLQPALSEVVARVRGYLAEELPDPRQAT